MAISDVVKKYRSLGTESDVMKVLGLFKSGCPSRTDIMKISEMIPGVNFSPEAIMDFLLSIGILINDEDECKYEVSAQILELSDDKIWELIVNSTIEKMFEENIIFSSYFEYESSEKRIRFLNEKLPLTYHSARDFLIELKVIERVNEEVIKFFVSLFHEGIIEKCSKHHTMKMSLDELRRRLEDDAALGEKAEEFVISFEKKRIMKQSENVRQISHIDVSAGYDIASFEGEYDLEYNRFIEVKAVSKHREFFWSKNEIDTARLKAGKYYLYLVDVNQTNTPNYEPVIISDPYKKIFLNEEEWTHQLEKCRVFPKNI